MRIKPMFLITNYRTDGTVHFYDLLPCFEAKTLPRVIGSNESICVIHPDDFTITREIEETIPFMGGKRIYLKR